VRVRVVALLLVVSGCAAVQGLDELEIADLDGGGTGGGDSGQAAPLDSSAQGDVASQGDSSGNGDTGSSGDTGAPPDGGADTNAADTKAADTNAADTTPPDTGTGDSGVQIQGCGGQTCAVGLVCCLAGGNATCASSCGTGAVTVACDDRSQCPSNQQECCATGWGFDASNPSNAVCASTCQGTRLCIPGSSVQCSGGDSCSGTRTLSGFTYHLCN
jgi:hypothetical protein